MMPRRIITTLVSACLLSGCQLNDVYYQAERHQRIISNQPNPESILCTEDEQLQLKYDAQTILISSHHDAVGATDVDHCQRLLETRRSVESERIYTLTKHQGNVVLESQITLKRAQLSDSKETWSMLNRHSSKTDRTEFVSWLNSLPHDFINLSAMQQYPVSRWQKTHVDLANNVRTELLWQDKRFVLDTYVGQELRVHECSLDGHRWLPCS